MTTETKSTTSQSDEVLSSQINAASSTNGKAKPPQGQSQSRRALSPE